MIQLNWNLKEAAHVPTLVFPIQLKKGDVCYGLRNEVNLESIFTQRNFAILVNMSQRFPCVDNSEHAKFFP